MFASWWDVHWAQKNCYLATTKCKALTLEPTSALSADELSVHFSVIPWFLNLKEGFQIDRLQCILEVEPCLTCFQAGGVSTGHRGTATWQPQSVKHSLWNPLLHSLQMIFHSAFQSYRDFILFFQQFKVKKVARFISSFKGLHIMNGVVSCCDMAKNTMNWAHTTFGPQRTIIFQVSFRCYLLNTPRSLIVELKF